jgi:hypothetical protein
VAQWQVQLGLRGRGRGGVHGGNVPGGLEDVGGHRLDRCAGHRFDTQLGYVACLGNFCARVGHRPQPGLEPLLLENLQPTSQTHKGNTYYSGVKQTTCASCRLRPPPTPEQLRAPIQSPWCLACLVLWTWSVVTGSPFFTHVSHPPGDLHQKLMLRPPHLQIDSDDEVPISRIPHYSPLFSCDSNETVLILRLVFSCFSSTSCPFVCPASQACGRGRCPLGYGLN